MNLIRDDIWDYELPWENCPEPRICTYMNHNVEITDMIKMYVRKEVQRGWWRDKQYDLHQCLTDYSGGILVSKERFGYGHFRMTAKVPGWRGSWPAFWLIDISGEMGIPPEIDIMEHMVKNCLSRYSTSCSYHDMPTNPNAYSRETSTKMWESMTQLPIESVDKREHTWMLEWHPDYLKYFYDGKIVMKIMKSQCTKFPDKPMNILVDLTIGAWSIKEHKEPFLISELNYY